MNTLKKRIYFLCVIPILTLSCTVTNNLYVNDPIPQGKGNYYFFAGLGTGLIPDIDSTSINGDIHYSNKLSLAPNLCLGGQVGLGRQTDLRFNVHFPYLVTGFGLHAGIQYSFFRKWTLFNAAIGSDIGFAVEKDTLRLGSVHIGLDPSTQGALNADFFLPVSYNLNEKCRFVLTPRMSLNMIFIRKNEYGQKSQIYSPVYPALSLGAFLNKLYLEATVQYIDMTIKPGFGIVYTFQNDDNSGD
jgi:hypothetical protein